MSSRLKILMISMISILLVLSGVAAYGYYSGAFSSSADELARAKQIDADSKVAKYASCSNGVCVGIDDYLDKIEPGQKITIKAWISVPAGKNLKVARYSGGYGFFSTYVFTGDQAYSPAQADEIIFPDGKTEFNMYVTIPNNPSLPFVYQSVTVHGRLVDSNAFGYGYGYGYNSENFVYLYANHSTPLVQPINNMQSSNPIAGAVDVSLNTTINAIFDYPLNLSQVSMLVKEKTMQGWQNVAGNIWHYSSWKQGNIYFTPNTILNPGTEYSVDILMKTTGQNFNWTFTTTKTKPPVLKITSPGNGFTTSASTIIVKGIATDEDTDMSKLVVKVKGNQVPLSQDGSFAEKVRLSYGANLVSITANDPDNNIATKEITINRKKPWWCWFGWWCR